MKILVITSCFAPKNIIGAVRISKLVKFLVREGHDLTVISPSLESYDLIDETLMCPEFQSIKQISVPYSNITVFLTNSHHNGLIKQYSKKGVGIQTSKSYKDKIYRFLRNKFACWRDYEWIQKVNKLIQSEQVSYDLVISSSPNVSTHDSAFYAKKTGKAKMWIADFRDPIVLASSFGRERERLVEKQSIIAHRADIITNVSQQGVKNFVCYPEDKRKVIWIPNGFDEEDLKISCHANGTFHENTKQIVFSYAGSLYKGERDCTPLFKAIHELVNDKLLSLDAVRFDYAGRDFAILKSQADKFGLALVLRDKGLISRKNAIVMQQLSDCVVVATFCYSDNGGAMTGKIFEPVMMKKYVLLLVNGPGKMSEPGTFVNYLNTGTVYEESEHHGNVTVIKQMILKMIDEKNNNGSIKCEIDENRRNEYNYHEIVKKLSFTIQSIK